MLIAAILFQRWVRETEEKDYWTGTTRFMTCVMVDESDLISVLKGPPPHKCDTFIEQHVTLVSADEKEGSTFVCLSSLVPGVYPLLEGCGWENFAYEEDVARPQTSWRGQVLRSGTNIHATGVSRLPTDVNGTYEFHKEDRSIPRSNTLSSKLLLSAPLPPYHGNRLLIRS